MRTRSWLVPALLLAMALGGCVVAVRPAPVARVVVPGPPLEYGYQPVLYHGYVVYYTDDGLPYYWVGGRPVWIPVAERAYYVSHWRSHRRAYRKWYKHRGRHYRGRRFQHGDARKHYRPAPRLEKVKPQPQPHLHKVEPYEERPRHKKKEKPRPRLKPAEDDDERPHLHEVD